MEFEHFLSDEGGSDDGLAWNDDEDDDNDDDFMNDDDSLNEQDSAVGKKRKSSQNGVKQNAKKLRKDRKVAPPTAEEMVHLRETETLFKSNLFRLEIEEMLKEIKPLKTFQNAANEWIEGFRKFCMGICKDEDWVDVNEVNVVKDYGVKIPLPSFKGRSISGHFKSLRPLEVKAIGSFYMDCTMGPKFNVDIAVILPKAFFRKKDYLNQTYHFKRALYLSILAGHLNSSKLVSLDSPLQFTCVSGDSLKPVLIVNPSGKAAGKIRMLIHVLPEEGTFKLDRYWPSCNNVRKAWWGCSSIVSELSGTPVYNSGIVEDLVLESNESVRYEAFKDSDNMKEAVRLLRVWLRQRHLDQRVGGFTSYIMSMVLVYLKDKQKINKHMSSYQIIRNVWLYLSQSDWCEEGATMCKAEPGTVPPISMFQGYFDVAFIDPTGYLNLTARMNKLTYLKVQRESSKAIELLDNPSVNGFQALFIVKMAFIHQYDHLISLFSFTNERTIYDTVFDNCSSGSEVDYNGDPVPIFSKLVGDLLVKGLGERAAEVGLMLPEQPCWNVDSERSLVMNDTIVFGIKLHPEHALNIIDRGPQANLPQAEDFREFWSDKAELRRFKDGVVCECVVWDDVTLPLTKRLNITKKVVSFLLQTKLNIFPRHYIYIADQLDHFISPKKHNVTAEEASLKIHKSLEELSRQLVELKELPLEITTVHCISPSYCYSDVFPPIALVQTRPSSYCEFTPAGHHMYQYSNRAPFFVPTVDLVLQMTFTRRWPDDLAACRRLTAAFYSSIANKLRGQHKLKFILYPDCLLVQKDGLMFRLFLGYSKEISLLKLKVTREGVKQYRDTPQSVLLEKKFISLPQIIGALHGLSLAQIGFGGGARLAKRWICSHMLDSFHFPPVIADLLVASLLLKPEPYSTLIQPQQIFLRFLNMLATSNWNTEILIINFNQLMSKEEIREAERKFEKGRNSFPPLVVVTPYDKSGTLWTKKVPTLSTLVRLAKLSSATLNILQGSLPISIPDDEFKSIFTPNLDLYDVVLVINDTAVPRESESIKWKRKRAKPVQIAKKVDSREGHSEVPLPVTNFDPPQLYLNYLRENYEEFALFFYDPYGGSNIGVLFKPCTHLSTEFKVGTMAGRCPDYKSDQVCLKTNFKTLISDFKEAGSGLIKSVIINKKFKQLSKQLVKRTN